MRQGVIRVAGQRRIVDPRHLGVFFQELRNFQSVVVNPLQAKRQRLDALQDQEGIEGRNGGAQIAQRHYPRTADIGGWPQCFGVDHPVVAGVGLVQAFETCLVLAPWELARIHNRPAQRGAVAAEVFGERVHHDVGAMLERAQQVGRRHRVVDNQRHAVAVRNVGNGGDIGHRALRVADGFDEHGLGTVIKQRLKTCQIARIGKARCHAKLRQGVCQQVVGAAIEGGAGNDVVARFGDGLDGIRHCRLPGGHRECRNAPFERRHALFQHVLRRVHDARVDVARHLQVEQVRAVLRVVKCIGHGLVDRHRHRLGGGVGRVSGVDGLGFKFPGFGHSGLSWLDQDLISRAVIW